MEKSKFQLTAFTPAQWLTISLAIAAAIATRSATCYFLSQLKNATNSPQKTSEERQPVVQ